jgi:hypothetical protein
MELAFLERASEFDTYGAELIVVKVKIFYVFFCVGCLKPSKIVFLAKNFEMISFKYPTILV